MFARVAAAHDRTAVEVHCYADQRTTDFLTDEIRASVERWHPVQTLSHDALGSLIQSHHIDVLIDLCGHTASNRLPVFAGRAAPVQLGWLGFSASTGIAAMDGVILGETMAPPGVETAFTEKIWCLPCSQFSYRPPDYAPEVAPPPHTRNGCITFGCFNNPAKIGHEVVALWATILHACPGSRLLLKSRSLADPHIADRMRHRFSLLGIDPGRLDVRGASTHTDMLAQYGDMDIALDPFPFCGGLTTCEALWMGVPVVTLPWLRPMSRQGQDLLQEVGLSALVARTPRDYARLAARLAGDSTHLQHLRLSLRERMRQSDLCDGSALSRALETVYVEAARATRISPS
jgi:predicted O-linked N-acetylglucosamine transferase (SPINDLY family)